MYPGSFGIAEEDCNCRCIALTRARWELDEDELRVLEAKATFFGLDKTKSFEEFKDNYLKAAETIENKPRKSIIRIGQYHVSDKGFYVHNSKIEHFALKEGAKHARDFFELGYTKENAERLLHDIEAGYDVSKAENETVIRGKKRFVIYMDLGVDQKKRFRTVWEDEGKGIVPRLITVFRKD